MKVLSILTNRKSVAVISDQGQQKFLGICDNILQPINIDSWGQFDEQKEKVEVVF